MLTIGQFSRVCQVSVKTLHHYDKIGLMHPQSVDRWTGYRYYSQAQIPSMLLIQRLKRYGFSLSEISDLLDDADGTAAIKKLKAQKQALLADMERMSETIREMDAHMREYERTGNIMSYQNAYEVNIEQMKAMPILSLRQKMSVEDFGKFYGKLFEQVARDRLMANGNVLAIYHDEAFDPECSDIEVAVGLQNEENATRMLEGGMAVTTLHKGSYSSLPDAYGAVMRYIQENGYEVASAPYEIYLKTQFDKLSPEQFETKIVFPVRKK